VSRPLTEAEKNTAKFPPSKSISEHILTNAQDSRPVVQDFVPLADSLEWELGQQYLRDRGASERLRLFQRIVWSTIGTKP
jgi:hypothetical protein